MHSCRHRWLHRHDRARKCAGQHAQGRADGLHGAGVTQPLPQMLDVDNPEAVVYACEGQPALALFTAMELVSNQTIEGDVIARRAGSIVCSSHKPQGLNVCTMTIEATAPFAKQVR